MIFIYDIILLFLKIDLDTNVSNISIWCLYCCITRNALFLVLKHMNPILTYTVRTTHVTFWLWYGEENLMKTRETTL